MAFEQRDMTGALFINDKRENERHPNAKGNALINGVEYWVSAWTKTDRNGNKFQSLAFEEKGDRARSAERDRADARDRARTPDGSRGHADNSLADELDDEVPF